MKTYYVESWAEWFVVTTQNKRRAYSVGVKEFGRGFVKNIREATKDEIDSYINQRSEKTIKNDEIY